MTTFKLIPKAHVGGTHGIGEIDLSPRRLVERFGRPAECDGYKVSGEFCFLDDAGRVYTLYDWKMTSLYNDEAEYGIESPLPTPQEFWTNEDPTEMHIGGHDDSDLEGFKAWLVAQTQDSPVTTEGEMDLSARTGMDEKRFWTIIESAWQSAGGQAATRRQLARRELSDEQAEGLFESLETVIPALRELLDCLSADELLAFDRILERKLYDIDRADVHEQTDGSDDGFLYARGFIVAAGQDYFDAVNGDPTVGMMDLECEEMCYLSWHLYEKKFGAMAKSGISRETGFNKSGWAEPG